uniref:Ectonucleoside triphosphate diphosphohydrolase 5-like n=1 Tax=Dermatophagoides pteronyssinus TaxID=6956 RepID=A0A6P6XLG7_DERPT|nr:ectonucleoside triphosphate diphosphohydrolase 5-like [Dermatophagoides pteronyssinus]
MKSTTTTMTFISFISTKIMTKQLYVLFILVTAISITGPFFSFDSKYLGTQLIRHPIELTKNMIKEQNFVIILDGGSTGTRIHVFAFAINNDIRQQKILLEREDFFHTTPGLSSFNDNLTELTENLQPLIDKALNIVPGFLTKQTPIILKATAGLRLLSNNDANRILYHVQQQFYSLPFKVDNNSVTMLEENDEGLFAWYTVNFLLQKLHKINESIATLDLGGGSTQITFSTYNIDTLIRSHQYIVQRYIEGEQEFIYTHSYLGLGLMSARLEKPIKNFNVENRAHRKIEQPKKAPWHPTTQKMINDLKKDDSIFKQMDAKNENLVDRLKTVKVDSYDRNPEPGGVFGDNEEEQIKRKQRLPQDRFGAPLPFVFYKPEQMPVGKITVLDIVDIILSHKEDNCTVEEIAAKYQLSEEDTKNIIDYVDVFRAVNRDQQEIPLFQKRDAQIEEIESGFKSKKSSKKKIEEIVD